MTSAGTSDDIRESRILDAANDLMVRYGYDKTTVREIADEAGVSKGTIYLHFDSKQRLFEALLVREMEKFSKRWLECVEADPEGGTIGSLYKNMLHALHSSELIQAIYRQDAGILGAYRHAGDNIFEKIYSESIHREFVESMQRAGLVRQDLDADVLAHVLDIVDYGFASITEVKDPEGLPPLEETVELVAQMMDRALTPEEELDREAGKEVARRLVDAYTRLLDGGAEDGK